MSLETRAAPICRLIWDCFGSAALTPRPVLGATPMKRRRGDAAVDEDLSKGTLGGEGRLPLLGFQSGPPRAAIWEPRVGACPERLLRTLDADNSPAWEGVPPLIQAEVKHLLDVRRGQRQNTNETA